jgi:membrane-associated phospholipid phosphatase
MKHYAFIDYATQLYLALVGVIILCLHGDAVPGWPWYVLTHAITITAIHTLIHASAAHPKNRFLDFLRHFYPVLLYAGLYSETGHLNQMVHRGYLDAHFYRLDQQIFGGTPSFAFMEAFPSRLVSEIFYAAYFTYYVMISGVGLALFFRNRAQFYHYISVTSFVFYACYLIYIFLPVVGPQIYYPHLSHITLPPDQMPAVVPPFPAAVQEGIFYRIMEVIYQHFESPGAAFPSSHVAIAIVTVYFSFLYLPKIRWPHLVLAVLLSLATVYCRYHYAIDVVAGVLMAALTLPIGNWLYQRFRSQSDNSRRDAEPQRN